MKAQAWQVDCKCLTVLRKRSHTDLAPCCRETSGGKPFFARGDKKGTYPKLGETVSPGFSRRKETKLGHRPCGAKALLRLGLQLALGRLDALDLLGGEARAALQPRDPREASMWSCRAELRRAAVRQLAEGRREVWRGGEGRGGAPKRQIIPMVDLDGGKQL